MTPEEQFDIARKLYPNPQKRGLETEFANFVKKNKNWREIVPLLLPAIQAQIEWRLNARGEWRPPWKIFPTWINQRWWEFSPKTQQMTIKKCYVCKKNGETRLGIVPNKTCKVHICKNCWEISK